MCTTLMKNLSMVALNKNDCKLSASVFQNHLKMALKTFKCGGFQIWLNCRWLFTDIEGQLS